MIRSQRISPLFPLQMAAGQFLACAAVVLVRVVVVYGKNLWNSTHAINFMVAWIPSVLSVLVAFIPDKDLERHMKIGWRVTVILFGFIYSGVLWHQQDLNDRENGRQIQEAVTKAVNQANNHSDGKLGKIAEDVGSLGMAMQEVGRQVSDKLGTALSQATGTINDKIGNVGKLEPPKPATLMFTLWDPTATYDKPVLSKVGELDADGNYPVDFSFANTSETTADSVDIWIVVCQKCSFAKDPVGFENPKGSDDRIRHRVIGSMNPGVSFEKTTILVKSLSTDGYFQVGFRYSCKTCGGKVPQTQLATITQRSFLPFKQP